MNKSALSVQNRQFMNCSAKEEFDYSYTCSCLINIDDDDDETLVKNKYKKSSILFLECFHKAYDNYSNLVCICVFEMLQKGLLLTFIYKKKYI